MKKLIVLTALLGILVSHSIAGIATFDGKDTSPNGYYKPNAGGAQNWTDAGMTFNMTEDLTYGYSWEGFAYSDVKDTTTGGFENQYAVYGGDGLDRSDSGVYAVGYMGFTGKKPTVSFNYDQTVKGFYANNTTYAALDMLNGSGFSKNFGGATGNDEDWFKMTVEGFDANISSLGTVDFYLADYRFADNGQDYIISDWTYVDLTSLGSGVRSIEFSLSSSDTGTYGMNTPSYFAIDDVKAVPEPASALLIAMGSFSIIGFRRYKAGIGA